MWCLSSVGNITWKSAHVSICARRWHCGAPFWECLASSGPSEQYLNWPMSFATMASNSRCATHLTSKARLASGHLCSRSQKSTNLGTLCSSCCGNSSWFSCTGTTTSAPSSTFGTAIPIIWGLAAGSWWWTTLCMPSCTPTMLCVPCACVSPVPSAWASPVCRSYKWCSAPSSTCGPTRSRAVVTSAKPPCPTCACHWWCTPPTSSYSPTSSTTPTWSPRRHSATTRKNSSKRLINGHFHLVKDIEQTRIRINKG